MHIFFSAGEPSGDEHAAHLIRELRQRDPGFRCDGFGGPEMQRQGCRLLHEMTQTAVMGFLKVIPLLAHFRRLVKQAEQHLEQQRPDLVVLVDFPGFNWWIARAAKKRGIPVYYYLPPQLWAWASWRIRRVRRWIDHVICALPFEFDWYRERGVAATWVGHPFFDEVADYKLDTRLQTELRPNNSSRLIGLLPGSRHQEVERNWPLMLQAADRVRQQSGDVRFVVACYRPEHRDHCQSLLEKSGLNVPLEWQVGKTSDVIAAADACLMVSGSVSLELLARRTPGVVIYSVSRMTWLLGKMLVHCRFATLTNLIANREVMPEVIVVGDPELHVQRITKVLTAWVTDDNALRSVEQDLAQLAAANAVPGATVRTAELLLNAVQQPSARSAA